MRCYHSPRTAVRQPRRRGLMFAEGFRAMRGLPKQRHGVRTGKHRERQACVRMESVELRGQHVTVEKEAGAATRCSSLWRGGGGAQKPDEPATAAGSRNGNERAIGGAPSVELREE